MELQGKVVMISGASKGLGAALARSFAAEGAALSLCARTAGPLESLVAELHGDGARCLGVTADIRLEEDVARWVAATESEYGQVDVLVNNASLLGPRVGIESYPTADWNRVLEVNLTGAFLCSRAVVEPLRRTRGSIINVSSGVGDHGRPLWGAYSVSKNGLEALSQIMAGELADDGVRVNAVDPGGMRTEMRAAAYPDEDPATLPRPEDIAEVFLYLASERSAGVTGQRFKAREFTREAAGGG